MKVIVADCQSLCRAGLIDLLKEINSSVRFIHAKNYDEMFLKIDENPDVKYILFDVDMPPYNYKEGLEKLYSMNLKARIIAISANEDNEIIDFAFKNGVYSYISKNSEKDFIKKILKDIYYDITYDHELLKQEQNISKYPDVKKIPLFPVKTKKDVLTKRKQEVLNLLCTGLSNKDIAKCLNLSEATIKLHVNSILKITNSKNRTQAILSAQKTGLLQTKTSIK